MPDPDRYRCQNQPGRDPDHQVGNTPQGHGIADRAEDPTIRRAHEPERKERSDEIPEPAGPEQHPGAPIASVVQREGDDRKQPDGSAGGQRMDRL